MSSISIMMGFPNPCRAAQCDAIVTNQLLVLVTEENLAVQANYKL